MTGQPHGGAASVGETTGEYPFARSAPECHLYMDLHPCECGERRMPARHAVVSLPNGALGASYAADCPGCGRHREFRFELDPQLPPSPPAFGGAAPSRCICPGEFLLAADTWAALPPTTDTAVRRVALGRAVAALEEVEKFIPAGADAVPEAAFRSPRGLAGYRAEPGRFRRDRLRAQRDRYAAIRDGLAGGS